METGRPDTMSAPTLNTGSMASDPRPFSVKYKNTMGMGLFSSIVTLLYGALYFTLHVERTPLFLGGAMIGLALAGFTYLAHHADRCNAKIPCPKCGKDMEYSPFNGSDHSSIAWVCGVCNHITHI